MKKLVFFLLIAFSGIAQDRLLQPKYIWINRSGTDSLNNSNRFIWVKTNGGTDSTRHYDDKGYYIIAVADSLLVTNFLMQDPAVLVANKRMGEYEIKWYKKPNEVNLNHPIHFIDYQRVIINAPNPTYNTEITLNQFHPLATRIPFVSEPYKGVKIILKNSQYWLYGYTEKLK